MGILKFLKGVKNIEAEKEETNEETSSSFRERAEKALRDQPIDLSSLSIKEVEQLIQELRLHRIESEMQNEELRDTLDTLQKKYADLYDFAPVGFCTFDRNGRIHDVNLTTVKQLGIERKLLIDTRFDEYIVQEDQEKFFSQIQSIFETKTRQICNLKLKRKNGSHFYAQLDSAILQHNGDNLPLCRAAISDITGLYQAENALLRRDSELALFNRVSQAFNSALELDQLLVTVLKEVRRLLEVAACSIWLKDLATNELVCRQAIGPYRDTVRGWRLEPGQGIVGWVAKTGKSLVVPDALVDDRHFKEIDSQTGQPLRSILSVPMQIGQEVIGVLQVLDTEVDRFNSIDQALQELLAAMASLAIENAWLHEQSRQDANTKDILLNEVNYRITTTLAAIISLLSNVRRHSGLKKYSISHSLMTDMICRVKGLKAVHNLLSEFEWNPVPLSKLSDQVIRSSLEALSTDKNISIEVSSSPIRISPEQANNLGLVINELVTNTARHALADRDTGRILIHIARVGDIIQFEFRDDGPGYPDDVLDFDRHNLGIYLIQKLVEKELEGKLILDNDSGAVAIIRFKPKGKQIND
jgi:PAS domain S-box-containing protein